MLYVVPTPIGNLKDASYRSLEVLSEVDYILAEDTRVTRFLLDHYKIDKKLKAFHAHNEHRYIDRIIEDLKNEETNIALVCDSGMPGVSDPGFLLIRACHQHEIPLTVLPGPSAAITAVVASGLPCDRFHFEGFLPHKKGRQTRLIYIAQLSHTVIIYESPHRLLKCLHQIAEHFGPERQIAVCKELSKKFERITTGTIEEVIEFYAPFEKIKGEFVLVVAGVN
ncbi:UNVERIFIED_CONTAM: hypothetical protein GTU68_067353 [Idotea baltica]|nr:hypothetical protein [Idotea baltica]